MPNLRAHEAPSLEDVELTYHLEGPSDDGKSSVFNRVKCFDKM
jgi:hypothetical protein